VYVMQITYAVAWPRIDSGRYGMSRDTELSTDDLAQPGGTRQETPPVSGGDSPGGMAGATATGGAGASPGAPSATGVEDRDVGERQGGADAAGPGGGSDAGPDDGTAVRETGAGADGASGTGQEQGGGEQAGAAAAAGGGGGGGADMALLDPADEERFRQRWSDVQARFVDDPQEAVQTADGLVAELMQSLASGFSGHKGRLEAQWQSGGNPDTEELRQALQRYRSFFNRLLST
jgi:hypothetical protein